MDTIGRYCRLCVCRIAVVTVSIAVKNTPIAKIESRGAALLTDSGFRKSKLRIGFESTDIPIAQGIAIIAANFRHEYMTLFAANCLLLFSSIVFAVATAVSAAVRAGVSEDAIGCIKADGT